MHRGYVRLYRKIIDSKIMLSDGLCRVFVYILISVTHKSVKVFGIDLTPGQMICGRKQIAVDLKVNEHAVYRHLKVLESEQVIALESHNKYSILTLLNWGSYSGADFEFEQQIEQQNDNKPSNKPSSEPSTQQEVISKKNADRINNIKNTGVVDNAGKQPLSSSPLGDIINNTLHDSYSGELPKNVQPEPVKTADKKKPAPKIPQPWREDFNVYLKTVNDAYLRIIQDPVEMEKQKDFNDKIDIDLTLQKAMHNFWAQKTGWNYRKKIRDNDLNMYSTLQNALSKPSNKVYKNSAKDKNVSMDDLNDQAKRFLERHKND